MTRHTNMIRNWKYDESESNKKSADSEDHKVSPPGERLVELKKSDSKATDDQPDISGWNVITGTGKKVGIVQDFLFDKDEVKVRYLIVNLKEGQILMQNHDILIPIGLARMDKKEKAILVPEISREKLAEVPVYRNPKSLARIDEEKTQQIFWGTNSKEHKDQDLSADFYNHRDFDEEHFLRS